MSNETETWRVLDEKGEVHYPVVVEAKGEPRSFFALSNEPDDDHSGWGEIPRLAVIDLARKMRWPVREILAPGELSAEERVAAETKRCAAVCRSLAAAVPPRWRGAADECADAIEREAP